MSRISHKSFAVPAHFFALVIALPVYGQTTNWDYPSGAQKEQVEGVTRVRLQVGADGLPKSCEIVQSADPELDASACKLMMEKGRFKPPLDDKGKPKAFQFEQSIRWKLPPPSEPAEPTKP